MASIKTPEEIKIMKEGGHRLALIMNELSKMLIPGTTGKEIEKRCAELLKEKELISNFQGYGGFPSPICISVNETVVHGVPNDVPFKDGDIVSLDCGGIYKGYHADMAISKAIGKAPIENKEMVSDVRKALEIGIKTAGPGVTLGDIGHAIQTFAEKKGYGVIRSLCGHGIGKNLHEDPQVPNYGDPGTGEKLKPGMVICLEPMISKGDYRLYVADDGYSYNSKDHSLTAHYEHMILITEDGSKVLSSA